ncbi:hypothetical protein ACF1FX_27605 [Streptomyces sp. NPDC014646]|uniref:hypothetical protein n=1 Tax=unclassified Streptomyces TaxID=2593676 RepID=UPI0036FCF2F6
MRAALTAGALGLSLSGCAGFLVPAGEGEPESAPAVTPSASYPPGSVHADKLPSPFPSVPAAWVSTPTGGDLVEGDALEIAPAPGMEARVFPLDGSDVRLLDELNMTAWRTGPA